MKNSAKLVLLMLIASFISFGAFAHEGHDHDSGIAILVNAGGPQYVDSLNQTWQADFGFSGGNTFITPSPIAGTVDDVLYQSERWTPDQANGLSYAFNAPVGFYEVRLHFAEIYNGTFFTGGRVFNVEIEGVPVEVNLDIFDEVGAETALVKSFNVFVSDSTLNIKFTHNIENPKISAIEIYDIPGSASIDVAPNPIVFPGAEVQLTTETLVTISNDGPVPLEIYSIELLGPQALEFSFNNDATYVVGAVNFVTFDGFFTPTDLGLRSAFLKITYSLDGGNTIEEANVTVSGDGIDPGHYAHAKPGFDQTVVDIDANGTATVFLNGDSSHTHAPGHVLDTFEWSVNGSIIATGMITSVELPVGVHTVTLTVKDTSNSTSSDSIIVTVLSPTGLSGLAGYYYDFTGSSLLMMPSLDGLKPDFGQIEADLFSSPVGSTFRGTPYSEDFAARYEGFILVPTDGTYEFMLGSDDGSFLFVNGELVINNDGAHPLVQVTGSANLTEGLNLIEILYFDGTGGAGLQFSWNATGSMEAVNSNSLFYNYATLVPVINDITPSEGPLTGGNLVEINGIGFIFNKAQTTVKVDGVILNQSQFTIVNDKEITFIAPPNVEGFVDVEVTTPNGVSNTRVYSYSPNALPAIEFQVEELLTTDWGLTTLAFGPDERLYVATFDSLIYALTLDDQKNVIDVEVITAIQEMGTYTSNLMFCGGPCELTRQILGIAFSPLDGPENFKIYISHSNVYNGGVDEFGGKISTVSSPNFDDLTHIITGLPTTAHDHGVFGIDFGMDGELYIQSGGSTNAGIPHPIFENMEESPLSSATLVADINKPGFDGIVTYSGEGIDMVQTGGFDVKLFAPGQRSSYDIVLHSNGNLYAIDNGPNLDYGNSSIDCNTTGPEPFTQDELNLVREGKYYGHPNRNRAITDPRECFYIPPENNVSTPDYEAPLSIVISSTNGITEYYADTFSGQMRRNLITSALFPAELLEIKLTPDGEGVVSISTLNPTQGGLDVTTGPDGTMYTADFTSKKVYAHIPVENLPVDELRVTGAFPKVVPLDGSRSIRIEMKGLNTVLSTTVELDGKDCPITEVTINYIRCTVPAGDTPGLVDMVVTNGVRSDDLTGAITYMNVNAPVPEPASGKWFAKANAPLPTGEISAVAYDESLYLFPAFSMNVFKYDLITDTWTQLPDRNIGSFVDHVTAQVIGDKAYLFGGLGGGFEGNDLMIYDIPTGTWSFGAPLTRGGEPFGVGSVSSGVIDGKMYIAGGINASGTVDAAFVYDPISNTWTEIAPMLFGRNHAAGIGHDGKFYVFTGRTGFNTPSIGSTISQVYNPATNVWSLVAPIPTPRGGLGAAVEINGELIVIGGEGDGPFNGTFADVEAYNPITNAWRTLPNITTARHGIYPVVINGRIHVVTGGTVQAFSQSDVHEVYQPETVGDQAELNITTSIPATISVNGKNVGTSPVKVYLEAGSNEIIASAPTYNNNLTNVILSAGEVSSINLELYQDADNSFLLRVNAGGPEYVDSLNQTWQADLGFNGGNTFITSSPIAGTVDDALYQSERWTPDQANGLEYAFNVPVGTYEVRLHFAEIYNGAFFSGARVFNVEIEGVPVEVNLDIFDEVGAETALVKMFNVSASDGTLNIKFSHSIENPKISAIEIQQVEEIVTPPPTEFELRLNAGGSSYVDGLGRTWVSDVSYVVGSSSVFSVGSSISGTVDDVLYQSERWSPNQATGLVYAFSVPDGEYNVTLHFAEIYNGNFAVGARVFDVLAENQLRVDNLDVFASVGANAATTRSFTVNVTDGVLNLVFAHQVENPKISAIEIVLISEDATPPTPTLFNLKVNAGGPLFVDSIGSTWISDAPYVVGSSSTFSTVSPISGTVDDVLYQSERWSPNQATGLVYAFSVPDGEYNVTLHFAEIYNGNFAVGARVFDVLAEGALAVDNVDVFASVGSNAAMQVTIPVTVNDGVLNLVFAHQVENPKISAIEIQQTA